MLALCCAVLCWAVLRCAVPLIIPSLSPFGRYVRGREDALPTFEGLAARATLPSLIAAGEDLAREQEMVNTVQLAGDYLKVMKRQGTGGLLSFG